MPSLTDYLRQTDRIEQLIAAARPTLERAAVKELARRDEACVTYCASEYTDPAPWATWLARATARETEEAYRRGYYHGYSQAMDDMKAARRRLRSFTRAWQALAEFFDGALTRWRYAAELHFDPPPSLPRLANGKQGDDLADERNAR